MQRRDVRRADREGVLRGVQRIVVELVHQQERGVLDPGGDAVRPVLRTDHELFVLRLVGLVHADQERDEDRHEHHHDPGAARELDDRDHDRDDEGRDRAQTVHEQPELPSLLPQAEVALGHPGLRQGERREHAKRVERDHRRDARPEDDDHQAGRRGQRHDAVREDQSVPALRELARHEGVAGVEAGQPREVGERRVGRQDQDQRRADLEHEEEEPPHRAGAVDGLRDARQDRLALVRDRDHLQPGGQERHREERRSRGSSPSTRG